MSSQFADVNGAKLHYEVLGKGSPVVLIHAGAMHMGIWNDQMAAFADQYRVIRYDIRGYGGSSIPPGPYKDHEDLQSLLGYLDEDKACLIGVSFGGGVAINAAIAYPEMVSSLVLVGSNVEGYEFTNSGFEELEQSLNDSYEADNKGLAAEYAAQIWVDGKERTREAVAPEVRARALEMIRHTFELPEGDGQRQAITPEAIHRLDEIVAPTYVIHGEFDRPDIVAIADLLQAGIIDCDRVVIPGTAHFPNMEKPAMFNKIVLDFLAKHADKNSD
jgi:pimeloyl-ACP methyl ester carboxylesterase